MTGLNMNIKFSATVLYRLLFVYSTITAILSCMLLAGLVAISKESWIEHYGNPGAPYLTNMIWSYDYVIPWVHLPWTIFTIIQLTKKDIGVDTVIFFHGALYATLIFMISIVVGTVGLPFFPRIM